MDNIYVEVIVEVLQGISILLLLGLAVTFLINIFSSSITSNKKTITLIDQNSTYLRNVNKIEFTKIKGYHHEALFFIDPNTFIEIQYGLIDDDKYYVSVTRGEERKSFNTYRFNEIKEYINQLILYENII